ncbi:Rieske (2Fe-2S) protein [Catenulispora rubra]|uniref:Rieske (2Fe-2S) protein n=1 Tax=Catenulispora rubra TaxID=280293 RepID=UPI0018923264|nr:Rieske (2Fe-2S) protein [Catenulispora rubra]
MTTVDLATAQTEPVAPQAPDEPACLSHPDGTRRRALLGGIVVAAGALCAACSSSKSSPAAAGTSSSATTGSTSSAAGSSTSSAGSSTSSSGSASSSSSTGASTSTGTTAALAATSAVPVGGGTILADKKIVLTQPTAGTYKAFTAICTHAGCTVSAVENGLIACPCHGSRYHIADGSVANGPATQALAAVNITVANGQITQA